MPLARARCRSCQLPLSDPPPTYVPVRCASCGTANSLAIASDGQPTSFDANFTPRRLLNWFASIRGALRRGEPGICLGGCQRCMQPIVVAPNTPVLLACPHCKDVVEGTAEKLLVDQWCEPWVRVEGNDVSLDFRLAMVEAREAESCLEVCTVCAARVATGSRCATCQAPHSITRNGSPLRCIVRVDGTRHAQSIRALIPISAGELWLRRDASSMGRGAFSRPILTVFAIGCGGFIALCVALGIAFATCK